MVHDEFQIEVRGSEELAREVGEIAVDSIRKAGEFLSLRIELDAEYKLGTTWKGTH